MIRNGDVHLLRRSAAVTFEELADGDFDVCAGHSVQNFAFFGLQQCVCLSSVCVVCLDVVLVPVVVCVCCAVWKWG